MRQEIAYALLALAMLSLILLLIRRRPGRESETENLRIDLFHGKNGDSPPEPNREP